MKVELSIQLHLKYTCLQRGISSNGDMEMMVAMVIVVANRENKTGKVKQLVTSRIKTL